jgi:hypothetical protein
MVHVVVNGGLGDCERGEIPDDDAKGHKRNDRNQKGIIRNQATFHKISITLTFIALNLIDCP